MADRGATAPFDRSETLRRAEKYRSQRRIRKAIREYEKILSVNPQDDDVHVRIAPLYLRAGRKEQAKASLRKVVAMYEKRGFVEKAIASLRLVLAVDRRDLAAHLHLADLYLGKGHAGDARKTLDAARRMFRGKRFRNEALAVEKKILGFAPDDFPAQVSLVRLLWKVGNRREALERLRRMEAEWHRRGDPKNWRKTRQLLCRFSPSLATAWGYVRSRLSSPAAPRPAKKA